MGLVETIKSWWKGRKGDPLYTWKRSLNTTAWFSYLPDPDEVLAKLGKDASVYRTLLKNPQVRACVQNRFSESTGRPWRFKPGDTGAAAAKSAETMEQLLKRLKPTRLFRDILDARLFGYSPIELRWENHPEGWLPEQAILRPFEWFRFTPEGELLFLSNEKLDGEQVEEWRVLLARSEPSYLNPYGEKLLSSCFWPVTFINGGMRFWATFAERYGMPWVVGKYGKNAEQEEKQALLENLIRMVQDAVSVIPPDASVELLADQGRGAGADVYDRLVTCCESQISKVILSQTLTTEMSARGGSYGASQTHKQVQDHVVDADCLFIADTINDLAQRIQAYNESDAPAPELEFIQPEDLAAQAALDKTLADGGVRFTKKHYVKVYHLEEDEFEVAPAAGPAPAATAGQGIPAEFAEGGAGDALAAQAAVYAAAAAGKMDPLGQMIYEELMAAGSYEEAATNLFLLYPKLNMDDLGEILADSDFLADCMGRLNYLKAGGGDGGGD